MIFNAWRAVAVDARKTREYFERLERGELDEDYDAESGTSGGGENFRLVLFVVLMSETNMARLY